jgi:hypothetical protein
MPEHSTLSSAVAQLGFVRPMEVVTASEAPAQSPPVARRWPVYVSRIAAAVFVLLYFFVFPLCYCPRYYLELSAIGLVPLIFGPRLYRYLGAAILITGLLSSEADRRGAIRQQQQIRAIREQSHAEQIRQHPELAIPPVPTP